MLDFTFGLMWGRNSRNAFRYCLIIFLDRLAFGCVLEEIVYYASSVTRDGTLVWDWLMRVGNSDHLVLAWIDYQVPSLTVVLGRPSICWCGSLLLSLDYFQISLWNSLSSLWMDFCSVWNHVCEWQLLGTRLCETTVNLGACLIKFLDFICDPCASQISVVLLVLNLLFRLLDITAISLRACSSHRRDKLTLKPCLSFNSLSSNHSHLLSIWIRLSLSNSCQIVRSLPFCQTSRLCGSVVLLSDKIADANRRAKVHHIFHLWLDGLFMHIGLTLGKHPLLRFRSDLN